MAKGKKLQKRRIWERIVAYANADVGCEDAGDDLLALHNACVRWIQPGVAGELQAAMPSVFSKDVKEVREGKQSLEVLAEKHQEDLRKTLRWLSQPEQVFDPKLPKGALAFLRRNVEAIEWEFDVSDKVLYVEMPISFRSIVSPICLFIWRQMELYHEGDAELKQIIPVGMCDRQGCGKFRVVKNAREGRFFCSNLCKATFHQGRKTNKQRNDYMRKYRQTVDRLNARTRSSKSALKSEPGKHGGKKA